MVGVILRETVEIKLEIDAEVPDGIHPTKQRTLSENGNTFDFTDNNIKWLFQGELILGSKQSGSIELE